MNVLVHVDNPGYMDIITKIGNRNPTNIVIHVETPIQAAYSFVSELGNILYTSDKDENGQSSMCINV